MEITSKSKLWGCLGLSCVIPQSHIRKAIMARKVPGKSDREGALPLQMAGMFGDEEKA